MGGTHNIPLVLGILCVATTVTAMPQCPNSTTVVLSEVVGSGSLSNFAAHNATMCCTRCVEDARCVAYTFEAKNGMCILKDNIAQCGQKPGTTSGLMHLSNRTAKQPETCATEKQASGYNWPPPSSNGSLWMLVILLVLVVVGGALLLVRNDKHQNDSSFSFPAEQVWHAACFSDSSYLPEIVLLAYRLVTLGWAIFILVDSYPNNAFCAHHFCTSALPFVPQHKDSHMFLTHSRVR